MRVRMGLAIGALALFLVALPAGTASAHDYCLHQGYDWGCVKNAHHNFSACDAEPDGAVVTSTVYDTDANGHVVQTRNVTDPDGSGGQCGVDSVPWVINDFKVCEDTPGPGGFVCEATFPVGGARVGSFIPGA